MKKTYNSPGMIVVHLGSRDALMSVSGTDSLSGTSYGGTTSDDGIIDADVKSINLDVNIWNDEW